MAFGIAAQYCRAQGSLAPPGPPQPSMKSLQDLWNAIATLQGEVVTLSNRLSQVDTRVSELWRAQISAVTPSFTTVATSSGGLLCSLAFSPDGRPAASFRAQDGTLAYAIFDGARWRVETVDSTVLVFSSSLAFSPGGSAAIAYYDGTQHDLLYAVRSDAGWITQRIATNGDMGVTCSLVFKEADPLISFGGNTNHVYLARWVKPNWMIEQVYLGVNQSGQTSLALTPGGQPAICFYDLGDTVLRYAEYDGSRWRVEEVQSNLATFCFCSLAFTPQGTPAISYRDEANSLVKYAERGTLGTWSRQTVDKCACMSTSLQFSPEGHAAIGYVESGVSSFVRYAEYDGERWVKQTVDACGVGGVVSLAFTPSGRAALCYTGIADGLKYAEVVPPPPVP